MQPEFRFLHLNAEAFHIDDSVAAHCLQRSSWIFKTHRAENGWDFVRFDRCRESPHLREIATPGEVVAADEQS